MSLMALIRGRKKKGETSAGTAKKRLMDLCIYHTGLDGDDAEQLIARIREAVLKILSEHFNAEIGMDNVSTNLKKENDISYIDLQVNLPDKELQMNMKEPLRK